MSLYSLARPLVFRLDAERAHRLTIRALKLMPAGRPPAPDPALAMRVAGIEFPNPVGLAAGFDKDAEVFAAMLGLGFGFVEIGTLTPKAQHGNPKPRLFRLAEDQAVINRMGFNNQGQEAAATRLAKRGAGPSTALRTGIVGVNIGANKESVAAGTGMQDYVAGVQRMAPLADYLTVNISSPNTPGLRALQDKKALTELLQAVMAERGSMPKPDDGTGPQPAPPPIFLKVAPDLEAVDVDDIVAAVKEAGIDALIVANTTISRPPLRSRHAGEAGGLSGAPLKDLALRQLRDFRSAAGPDLPLIAAGGIGSGADAWARIKAGASLVQLYSALVYEGPGLARRINRELRALVPQEGFATLAEAVGSDA